MPMRKMRTFVSIGLFTFSLFIGQALWAANFKPIELHPDYNHTKYAPVPSSNDIVRQIRAYTACFDGDDDDGILGGIL